MSPSVEDRTLTDVDGPDAPNDTSERIAPVCASTPLARPLTNGHGTDKVSRVSCDTINGNVNVHIVSESTNSMDVLSGGESDAGDTLNRRNNNSISSTLTGTLTGTMMDVSKRRGGSDPTYFVAKELLMTERTYKRDVELVTVTWSSKVSGLALAGADAVSTLARACLALEPLALPAGTLLAKLERSLAQTEGEWHRVASSRLGLAGADAVSTLARACLALEPLALPAGTLLAKLERSLAQTEGEWHRVASSRLGLAGADAVSTLARACLALEPLALPAGTLLAKLERSLAQTEGEWHRVASSRLGLAGADAVSTLARACLALEPLALPAGTLLAKLERSLAQTEGEWHRVASSRLGLAGADAVSTLARACLALEPLALPAGTLLAKLERSLAQTEGEWHRVASSRLGLAGADAVSTLARACLALEPLALPAGTLLAKLERSLAQTEDNEEPEYKRIAELLYDYLSNTYEAYSTYTERSGPLVATVESVRRRNAAADKEIAAFDSSSPLPLTCLLLRPLHRLLHLERLAVELSDATNSSTALKALDIARALARDASDQLRHAENHAALCQLQRDIIGYDKLLVADREFVRLGCVYKHSTHGMQQRMLFLFTDLLILASKAGSSQFRALAAAPLHALEVKPTELPHSFTITGDDFNVLLSASNDQEFGGWIHALELAIESAKEHPTQIDTELTPYEQEAGVSSSCHSLSGSCGGGALTHVCWHRVTALSRDHLHLATRTQLSGYLLRKFKNSHGWQKLWVVFAAFTLFFYKSWQDENPLASLPLLGYNVGPPAESDAIHKDYVFKLQFKNHVYFFRADSNFTYHRWTEVLQTAMVHHN